jgi:hypothetical protein
MKPILFLDVDGVINTVIPNEETGQELECEGFRICIPKLTKERIERLQEHFEMVWCTTWRAMANKHFNPLWGWEDWPVVGWGAISGSRDCVRNMKLPALVEFAEDRPWVFVDDDADWELREIEKSEHWDFEELVGAVPHLVLNPHVYTGLTDEHVEKAVAFAATLP